MDIENTTHFSLFIYRYKRKIGGIHVQLVIAGAEKFLGAITSWKEV